MSARVYLGAVPDQRIALEDERALVQQRGVLADAGIRTRSNYGSGHKNTQLWVSGL